eukprot:403702-Ditylum_brightwellii.AAC.1
MSTYSSNIIKDEQKILHLQDDGTSIELQYTEVFSNYYEYRDAVDSNNNKCHDGGSNHDLSLEETWKTTCWTIRIVCFILAVVEVNAFLAKVYFQGYTGTQLDFCKPLAYELVNSKLDREDKVGEKPHCTRRAMAHTLCTMPKFCTFVNGKITKRYKSKYQHHFCYHPSCTKCISTFCNCLTSMTMCSQHFVKHCTEAALQGYVEG